MPIEPLEPTVKGDFSPTASLMSFKGIVDGPAREGAEQFILMLNQLENSSTTNGSTEVAKSLINTSNTLNTGLAAERMKIPLYICLTVVGVAMLALAVAAIAYTNVQWGTRVGLGGASAGLAAAEVKILGLLAKVRNQIAADHLRLVETIQKAKKVHDDMDRRERAVLLHAYLSMVNPDAANSVANFMAKIFGTQGR